MYTFSWTYCTFLNLFTDLLFGQLVFPRVHRVTVQNVNGQIQITSPQIDCSVKQDYGVL